MTVETVETNTIPGDRLSANHPPPFRGPIEGPSVWYGPDLANSDEWIYELSSAEQAEILAAFYQAINLYPPELSQLLPFGVRAELAEGREEDAATLLQQWVLFHLRVLQPTGEPLPLDPAAVAIVQEHRPLLDGWIGEAFDQMMQNAAH